MRDCGRAAQVLRVSRALHAREKAALGRLVLKR